MIETRTKFFDQRNNEIECYFCLEPGKCEDGNRADNFLVLQSKVKSFG